MSQHNKLSAEKWHNYPEQQQILMIANELNRAGNWMKKQDERLVKSCIERALELTQLTIDDARWKLKLKELCRFNELLAEQYSASGLDFDFNETMQKTLIALSSAAFNLMYGRDS